VQRATADQLASDPVGRYVAGAAFAHFCAAPGLWGVVLWGHPSLDDARVLGRTLVLELAAPAVPHVSLIDARRLAGTDPLAFRAAEAYLRHNADALATWVRRLAVVRSPGLTGAIMAGAYDVVTRPYPVEVFDDAAAAFGWLDCDIAPGDGAALLDAIHADATGVPPDLAALRAVLDARVDGATLARAAKSLGISQRSLQRKLTEAGTTFTCELAEARVRLAKRLLLDTDTSLTEIAFEVGCTSLQSFSVLFRRHSGEAPSAFRERTRTRR